MIDEHGEAIEYELLTRTNYCLDDVGGRLPWSALYSFVNHLGTDSALARELGKSTGWETTLKTNEILANIYDQLQLANVNLARYFSRGKKNPKFTPYPRPGKGDNNSRKIGSDPMTPDELRKWYFKESDNG